MTARLAQVRAMGSIASHGLLSHQDSFLKHHGSPPTANWWPHCGGGGGGSYIYAEVQLAYSIAPADRAYKFRI